MYKLIAPRSRRAIPLGAFEQAYQQAADVASLKRVYPVGPTHVVAGVATVPVVANTRVFGHVHQTLHLRLVTAPAGFRVLWAPELVFPGLEAGEHLRTHTKAPYTRGAIRARDGEILASGPASNRVYPQGSAFSDVTGYVKTPAADRVAARVAKGWPARRPYGQAGLEQSLDGVLSGRPRSISRPSPRPARCGHWASAPVPSPKTWSPRFASTSSTTWPTRWVGGTAGRSCSTPSQVRWKPRSGWAWRCCSRPARRSRP